MNDKILDRIEKTLDEDEHAALVLDQGHVLMAAKADGMRIVIKRMRNILDAAD